MTSLGAEASPHQANQGDDNLPEPNPALSGSALRAQPDASHHANEDWLDRVDEQNMLSTASSTAQVEPHLFTSTLFKLAQDMGLQYMNGSAQKINRSYSSSRIESVTLQHTPDINQSTIPCTTLLVACGSWSSRVASKLNLPPLPISYLPGHSLILQPKIPLPPCAVFASI